MDYDFKDSQIEELRNICEQIFETEFTTDSAHQMALNLYDLYKSLGKIAESSELDWERFANEPGFQDQP